MANKIRELRKSRGMTLEDLAAEAGLSPSHLSRIEKGEPVSDGGRGLSLENAVKIARALKCEVTDFTADFSEDDIATASGLALSAGRRPKGDVPNLTIHAGMGSGGLERIEGAEAESGFVPGEFTNGYWSFPEPVRDRFKNMAKTHALPVVGDSMQPTLIDGAVVFVDTAHTVPSPPDLYAVDYGDGLMVKRVELVPRSRKVKVISDNDRYGTYEMNRADLHVFGRVIAWFQWRG